MVAAVLKLYFIGTALSVLAILYGLMDSVGGLMYVPDNRYLLEMEHQTQGQLLSGAHRRAPAVTRHIGS